METPKLTSEYRETRGKGEARKMRALGKIPAALYGHSEDPISLALNELDLKRMLSAGSEMGIVGLKIHGKVEKECDAIIKEIQRNPATGKILHLDFQYVHKGEKLRLEVSVVLNGEPRGVKEMGGILEHGSRELSIRCFPRHIPESIELDVAELGIQESIHLGDIIEKYPDLEFLDDPDTTLANVVPPKIEAEPTAEDELTEGEQEPEVIAKGKEEKADEAEGEGKASSEG